MFIIATFTMIITYKTIQAYLNNSSYLCRISWNCFPHFADKGSVAYVQTAQQKVLCNQQNITKYKRCGN